VRYMLDTNVCIFLIHKKAAGVLARLRQHAMGEIGVSTITVAELRYGADKSQRPAQNHAALDAFLAPLVRVGFDSAAADCYGPVRAELERLGMTIGPLDTLIAAHALSLDAILVTNNSAEFSRVSGLTLEDWTQP
jgi:tRNA(fMet)-specific endonuclease VapC